MNARLATDPPPIRNSDSNDSGPVIHTVAVRLDRHDPDRLAHASTHKNAATFFFQPFQLHGTYYRLFI